MLSNTILEKSIFFFINFTNMKKFTLQGNEETLNMISVFSACHKKQVFIFQQLLHLRFEPNFWKNLFLKQLIRNIFLCNKRWFDTSRINRYLYYCCDTKYKSKIILFKKISFVISIQLSTVFNFRRIFSLINITFRIEFCGKLTPRSISSRSEYHQISLSQSMENPEGELNFRFHFRRENQEQSGLCVVVFVAVEKEVSSNKLESEFVVLRKQVIRLQIT